MMRHVDESLLVNMQQQQQRQRPQRETIYKRAGTMTIERLYREYYQWRKSGWNSGDVRADPEDLVG